MANSSFHPESAPQQPGRFLAGLQVFDGIFDRLVSLFRMTDEERDNAGIYIVHEREEQDLFNVDTLPPGPAPVAADGSAQNF